MNRRAVLTGLAGLLGMSLAHPHPGAAILGLGDIVHDPINLVQNTFTAVRSLVSNANEVTTIQNQIVSLANEARQLASLPLSLISEIDAAIANYTTMLAQGQGISYQLQATTQQFEALYNQGFGGEGSFMQRAQRMLGQVRAAGQLSAQVTAIYDRLCAQQTRVGQLLAASQAAVGSVQAQQSGNQLLGIMAEQQVSMQQILAAEQRLKVSESMRQLVMDEKAYQNAQDYGRGMMVVPIRAPGEGQGFTLPQ